MKGLEESRHRSRHIKLHLALDELLADMIGNSLDGDSVLCQPILDLLMWSYKQTKIPDVYTPHRYRPRGKARLPDAKT